MSTYLDVMKWKCLAIKFMYLILLEFLNKNTNVETILIEIPSASISHEDNCPSGSLSFNDLSHSAHVHYERMHNITITELHH